ncbi:MAG: hypothetical protein ACI8X5_002702 [Planctomycetota bacterium]|jgi:hypothetical protein
MKLTVSHLVAAAAAVVITYLVVNSIAQEEQESETTEPMTAQKLFEGPESDAPPTLASVTLPPLAFEDNSKDLPSSGSWREHPSLADLDHDGKADLVASNREENGLNVWKSAPGAPWEPKLAGIAEDLMYGGSDCGDLDGDGNIDILFASHNKGLRVLLNDGKMNWTEVPDAANATFLALDVSLGNLNNDEHLDAVTVAQFAERNMGAVGVYIGTGEGHFTYRKEFRDGKNLTGRSRFGVQIQLADFTGDGLDDILVTAEKGCMAFVTTLSAEGELGFEDRSKGLPPPPANMGNTLRSLIPIDVDGDGQFEVAFASLINPVMDIDLRYSLGVLRWDAEAGSWQPFGSGLPNGNAYTDALTADFNGDQNSDLLVVGTGMGASIYLGNGKGDFEPAGMLKGTMAGGRAAIGDIDGDGKPDVVVICGATKSRPDAGAVRTFLNRDSAW